MKIENTILSGVLCLTPKKHGDARGFFSESYNVNTFAQAGIDALFIQDNHVLSTQRYVLRGMHFQKGESAQAKLVRVVEGAILDVVVDMNPTSPTYGQHVAVELSAQNWKQIFVPAGYAHGYITLTDQTQVLYKVTKPYDAAQEGGINPLDENLRIEWPTQQSQIIMNERDRNWPKLSDLKG